MAGLPSPTAAAKGRTPVNWGLCLVALMFGGWKIWEHCRDVALEEQARVRAAQMYLVGIDIAADPEENRWHDDRAAVEWRDISGNALRLDAVWNESLTVAGQLAASDGTVMILDGALDPATLPAPARMAGGYGLDPDRIGRVAFSCESRSAVGERGGVLQVRTVPSAPAPTPRLPSGGIDSAARFRRLAPDGADEIEAIWTPDGGPPRTYLLWRMTPAGDPVPQPTAPATPGGWAKLRAWIVTLFWIGAIGFGGLVAVGFLQLAYERILGSISPVGGLRRQWVEDVVRLLMLMVRMTRDDQNLGDRERSLIRSVAATEARRPEAPGPAVLLGPTEIDALIREYKGECPGVPDLIGFLAEPANAASRTRLFKRLWQVAVCDGPASDNEVEFAQGFAVEVGMSEAEFLSISRRYYRPSPPAAALDEARSLLEVSRSATADDVKRAYKRKAREYHPDAHAGVAENLKRLTAERFSKLGEAKELLFASLGQVLLVGRDPSGRLVPAEDLPNKVRCFCCGAVRPGVLVAEAYLARCPKCLALLYHEPGFAAELSRETREPATAAAGSG